MSAMTEQPRGDALDALDETEAERADAEAALADARAQEARARAARLRLEAQAGTADPTPRRRFRGSIGRWLAVGVAVLVLCGLLTLSGLMFVQHRNVEHHDAQAA